MKALVPCPACCCHVAKDETICPLCGHHLLARSGTSTRTAGAILLGLAVAVAAPACGDSTGDGGAGGSGATNSTSATNTGSTSSQMDATTSSTQSTSATSNVTIASTYGIGPSSNASSGGGE